MLPRKGAIDPNLVQPKHLGAAGRGQEQGFLLGIPQKSPARMTVSTKENWFARGSALGKDLVAEIFALAWLIKGKEKPRRSLRAEVEIVGAVLVFLWLIHMRAHCRPAQVAGVV